MDIQKLMQQAQQMQDSLTKIQEELEQKVYEGNSGGKEGVTVYMNGGYEVEEIIISDDLMGIDNKEMLQDMLLIATNNVLEQIAQDKEDNLGKATNGLDFMGL